MSQELGQEYLMDRLEDQYKYFDDNAKKYQTRYRRLKSTAIMCNILTTMAIALAFTVPENYKVLMGIIALILSTIVLGTYQWEEFQNNGAKWEKFRLVAEQLKSEKYLFLNQAGHYAGKETKDAHRLLVETVESIIRGTDLSYFTLMVEPGKRIEKRLQSQEKG